jgi:hypothetical protein
MSDPRREPWLIDEADFYEIEDGRAQKEFLLRYAVLAPSGHNTQPWTFRIADEGVEVRPDYSRRLPVADPADRELMISIGAAITNLRVAAAHFGFESTTLYDGDGVLIALRETCKPDEQLCALFPAITQRHTNRADFDRRPIDPDGRRNWSTRPTAACSRIPTGETSSPSGCIRTRATAPTACAVTRSASPARSPPSPHGSSATSTSATPAGNTIACSPRTRRG